MDAIFRAVTFLFPVKTTTPFWKLHHQCEPAISSPPSRFRISYKYKLHLSWATLSPGPRTLSPFRFSASQPRPALSTAFQGSPQYWTSWPQLVHFILVPQRIAWHCISSDFLSYTPVLISTNAIFCQPSPSPLGASTNSGLSAGALPVASLACSIGNSPLAQNV